MRICEIQSCNSKHYGKGYCQKHYLQVWRYGKPFKRTRFDPNEVVVLESHAEIVLYNQKNEVVGKTKIDISNVKKVSAHKWCMANTGYAVSQINGTIMLLHKLLTGYNMVDHIDRNKLNNIMMNLRECTVPENLSNRPKPANNTSGYKGVSFAKDRAKYNAQIGYNGNRVNLGYFHDKIEAAKAYNRAALKYHGEFACINEII